MSAHVGRAIAAAIARAKAHEQSANRKLRVRVTSVWGDDTDALTIAAWFAARDGEELERQRGRGAVRVPWEELDARAGELAGLVDQAVADAMDALGMRPDA